MEDAYIVHGGNKIEGKITVSGAKNLALKTIIASLLFESPVTLTNVPAINDVHELIHVIKGLGATVTVDQGTVTIDPTTVTANKPDLLHASMLRASFLLFAPLLHRFQTCFIPNPGGCRIGQRPIDRIVSGMEALGVRTTYHSEDGYYEATLSGSPSGSYRFEKPTHTGTELMIMLAARGTETVTLENAALEPEIDELIRFLNESGASIVRSGGTIEIQGVGVLKQHKEFRIFGDRNEAVTFASMALATGGSIEICDIDKLFMIEFDKRVIEAGASVEYTDHSIVYRYTQPLKSTSIITAPHPGFMTDWQPNWAVLMTQAEGVSSIHETVFENRFSYVDELRKLSAKIEYAKPDEDADRVIYHFNAGDVRFEQQKIYIHGGQPLHEGVLKIADLRAGATLMIAALLAPGETIISNASILERGYENIVEKITALGGSIKRV